MHAWEAIQKTVDYIEDNLSEKITTEELAAIAALSPFYFQRLFTRLVNKPVGEYVKLRRLARSCEALKNKNKRILDVALEFGFNSHESYTKAFKTAFDITPDEYRKNPIRLNQILKPELLLNYTMIDEDVPLITDNIVIEITRKTLDFPEKYVGITGQVAISSQLPLGETTGVDTPGVLWDTFHKNKPNILGLIPDGIELGASMMDESGGETFTYFAGGTADDNACADEELTIWELPAAEYVVCCFEAESFSELTTSALNKAMKYLFGTWLQAHDLVTQPFSAEKYYKTTPDAT
ncbi:MAG: AraC family transcriptional regulator, partial [Clostridia bacterium]|nr:AraC family transcriptional regulator [Clostridia bacterium]